MKAYLGAILVCLWLTAPARADISIGKYGQRIRLVANEPTGAEMAVAHNKALLSDAINRAAAARDYAEEDVDHYASVGKRAAVGDEEALHWLVHDRIISPEEALDIEDALGHVHAVGPRGEELHRHPEMDRVYGGHTVTVGPEGERIVHHRHPPIPGYPEPEEARIGLIGDGLLMTPDGVVVPHSHDLDRAKENAEAQANRAILHADEAVGYAKAVKDGVERAQKERMAVPLSPDAPKEMHVMREHAEVFLAEDHEDELGQLTRDVVHNIRGAEAKRGRLVRKVQVARQIMQGIFPSKEEFHEMFVAGHDKDERRMMEYVGEATVDPSVKRAVAHQLANEEKHSAAVQHMASSEEVAAHEKREAEAFAKRAYQEALHNGLPAPLARLNGKIARVYAEEFARHLHEGESVPVAGKNALHKAMQYKEESTGERAEKRGKKQPMGMKDFMTLARRFQKEKERQAAEERAAQAARVAELEEAKRRTKREFKDHMVAMEDPAGAHQEAYRSEEEKASYNDHKQIKEAGKRAMENILKDGGTPQEAAAAAETAEQLMAKRIEGRRRQKAAHAEEILKSQQLDPAVAHRMAEHLAAAHDEKKAEHEEKISTQDLGITTVIPDTESKVELKNAVVKLPFDEIPDFKATSKSEAEAKKRQRDLRDKIRNTYTKKRIPSGLPVIKTDKGFLNVAENAKKLKIKNGKVYFGQGAYNTMKEQGIDVSGLAPKIVSGEEGESLEEGSAYYEAAVSGMSLAIPTPTKPHPSKMLSNANESLNISLASKLVVEEGELTMEPMESFAAKIRPAINKQAEAHQEEHMAKTAEQLFEEQEKKEASHVEFISTPNGESIVSITPSYGHSKRMHINDAMHEFGKSEEKHEEEEEEEKVTPLNMAETLNGSRLRQEFIASGIKAQGGTATEEHEEHEESHSAPAGEAAVLMQHAKETAAAVGMDVVDFKAAVQAVPAEVFDEARAYYSKLADNPERATTELINLSKQKFHSELKQRFPNARMEALLGAIFEGFRKETGKPNILFDKLVMKIPVAAPPAHGSAVPSSSIQQPLVRVATIPARPIRPARTQNNPPASYIHLHPMRPNPTPGSSAMQWHAPLANAVKGSNFAPMNNRRAFNPVAMRA